LEKVHFFLPRIPKVTIQLFKENNHAGEDDDDHHEVTLKDF
jgi:hypothetical protein